MYFILCASLSRSISLQEIQYELCQFRISCSKKRKCGAINLDEEWWLNLAEPVSNDAFIIQAKSKT